MTYIISRAIYAFILKAVCGLEVLDRKNFPEKGPFIIAANHASWADPPVVGVALRNAPVRFMAKRELCDRPIFGRWCKAVRIIPIERSSTSFGALKKAFQALEKGEVVGVFPEGTRSVDGRLKKPEAGTGFLAAKAKVPVIPVYISGTDKVLPKGRKMLRFHKVKAKIGRPLDIEGFLKVSGNKKDYQAVSDKIMSAIADLKKELEG